MACRGFVVGVRGQARAHVVQGGQRRGVVRMDLEELIRSRSMRAKLAGTEPAAVGTARLADAASVLGAVVGPRARGLPAIA